MNEYSSGDTSIKATDINIALNGARMFKFQKFDFNDGLSDVSLTDIVKAVAFPSSGTPYGYLKLDLRNFDITKDINFVMEYCMSTTGSSNSLKFKNTYAVYNDGRSMNAVGATANNSEEFTVQNQIRQKFTQIFSTLKIPATALSSVDDFVNIKFERLNTGLSGTNHAGDFELISLIAFQ